MAASRHNRRQPAPSPVVPAGSGSCIVARRKAFASAIPSVRSIDWARSPTAVFRALRVAPDEPQSDRADTHLAYSRPAAAQTWDGPV